MFEQLAAWLEKFPPATRILIVALVPAFLVFALEELTRARPHPVPVAVEKPAEAPLLHSFTNQDVSSVARLSSQSQAYVLTLDQSLSQVHATPDEIICLNGMRSGGYAYINAVLSRLQQELALSVHMQNADDEALINASIMKTVGGTLADVPKIETTIVTMNKACQGNSNVAAWAQPMKIFLEQLTPVLNTLQAHGRQPKQGSF